MQSFNNSKKKINFAFFQKKKILIYWIIFILKAFSL